MKASNTLGLSILAGGLAFVGTSKATDIVVDGSYESATNNYVTAIIGNGGNDAAGIDGGWTHFSTYNYSAGYTRAAPAGAGRVYLRPYNDTGGSMVVSQTNSLSRAITAASIDAGVGQYSLSAWFCTYRGQNDYSVLTLQFLDGSFTSVGSPIEIGGAAFIASLPGGGGLRDWGRDARNGAVPAGARYAALTSVSTAVVNLPDGYVDLVQLDIATNATISVASAVPADAATDVSPGVVVSVVLQDGSPTPVLNTNSIRLSFDGVAVLPSIQKAGGITTIQYDPPGGLAALSTHNYRIAFNNLGGATPNRTNEFSFTVANYYNILLNSPIYFENFESTTEGGLPTGWSSFGFGGLTDPVCDPSAVGIGGLQDLHSACYTNWVVIDSARFRSNMLTYASHTPEIDYLRVLDTNRLNVVNGAVVGNLAQGKIVFGNSGYQDGGGSQIVYLFSPDFDLTGKTNVYLAFHSLWEQNQDSIGAVEYSIDQGATWLPIVYMLDNLDILRDSDGNIDAAATLSTVYTDVATYIDPADSMLKGGYYGAFIGVASNNWSGLVPYISGRVDDDQVESKRVEVYPLPAAANQARVRLRFAHAGTDSWYFGVDNVGLYSLTAVSPPAVSAPTPSSLNEALGNSAAFTVNPVGVGPFTYQWRHNGVNLAGQTNATLALSNIQLASAGSYVAVVGYVGGSITSSPVALTVFIPEPSRVIGQWDFDNFDVTATCGTDLEYPDQNVLINTGFADSSFFDLPLIEGQTVKVMAFPGAVTGQPMGGYRMRHGLGGTGGGTNVNQYTLIMDIIYPSAANNLRRTLLQTDPYNTTDGDFRIEEANRVGVGGNYHGTILPNTWYRVALAVDLAGPGPNPVVAKFINGIKVGQHALAEGRDGRWSLSTIPEAAWALLLGDDDVDAQAGYVSSVQLRSGRLPDVAIAAMGGPQATKIPGAICVQAAGSNLTIRWSGSVLESADQFTGPWNPIAGATKPYSVPTPLGGRKFYRSR
jgi:hypothetical protein